MPVEDGQWVEGPRICDLGGSGMVFPVGGDDENQWSKVLRAFLYAFGLVYFFLGVAIIADTFVAAIETVTLRKTQSRNKEGRLMTSKVWNDTVATLSLMALGSSAPEIALSVVDLFKTGFHFAPLGAVTIAGSAAFNLFVIVAVCIIVIPSTETRQVVELPAFYVTAVVSVFAYLWLALILTIRTPDVVEIWEAVATFLFLPMLIWISYRVDIGDATRLVARLSGGGADFSQSDSPLGNGLIGFEEDELSVEASSDVAKVVEVKVKRQANCSGAISVGYRTERLRAVPSYDFTEAEGRLEFAEEANEQIIRVEVLPKAQNRVERKFLLLLEDAEGKVEFDHETDGGKDAAVLTVTITTSGQGGGLVRYVEGVVNFNGVRKGLADWKDQITSTIYCLGSAEEQKEASGLDWVCHFISLPWKLLFSLVPPTSLWGGWVCFYIALAGIGILTIGISDMAELFGCVLDIRDDVTAITFVALGTSMPDLFASLSAAKEEPTADASIVNVTGSNSVNVFLGLGLPWTIGAIYWTMKGQSDDWRARYNHITSLDMGPDAGGVFVVESGNLGFCVLVFGLASAAALGILHLRRRFLGAELGGPFVPKVMVFSAFMLYWFGFIGVSSWRVDRWAEASAMEMVGVMSGVGIFEVLVSIAAIVSIIAYRVKGDDTQDGNTSDHSYSRSQSGHSIGSGSSKNSSKKQELQKAQSSSSLSEGIVGVGGGNGGIGLRVLKPRFANSVSEQRI
mmetsp:Transcript_21219/g.60023  ORF Transcript_21219/g.60023 Transcript_21219/m.60023 type:complete len:738 (+) Transcript_21219:149-2362(+)